ncbi:transmembrane protein [Mycolicibacterium farcinogenes]|nr:transmembrane protein [Mycolicibacterium farcinogenes]
MLVPAAAWQRQVSALMGMEGPATLGYLRTLIITVAVGAALIATARMLRDAVRLLARMFIRRWHLHREVAQFIGTAIVVVLVVTPRPPCRRGRTRDDRRWWATGWAT